MFMAVFHSTANLCYLLNGRNEVLLQLKSRGFGQGKWNGPGGKVEAGESIEQSVVREVKEETGLAVKNLRPAGELEFIFQGREDWNQRVHVFVVRDFGGEIKTSEEGELKWFKISKLPFSQMWEDDAYWLKDALTGKFIRMRFCFDDKAKLQSYEKI
jgi:8-oxo-dGTP diphosphatase